MKTSYLFPILGLMDKINEWNDQLNAFADKYLGNLVSGTVLFFAILIVAFWAVAAFNKQK